MDAPVTPARQTSSDPEGPDPVVRDAPVREPVVRSSRARRQQGRAVACYCHACERVLYVADPTALFCPVCSSSVISTDPQEAVEHPVEGVSVP